MPSDPEAAQPDSLQRELRLMLEKAVERVLANLDKYGWSIPLAYALSREQKLVMIVDGEALQEDAESNAQLLNKSILDRVDNILLTIRRMISEGRIRAFALAYETDITVDPDCLSLQQNAVKVILDHEAQAGTIAYVVYDPNSGNARPLEIHYNALTERYFP